MILDVALWKQLKHRAIDEGRSPGRVVEDAIALYLAKREHGAKVAALLGVGAKRGGPK